MRPAFPPSSFAARGGAPGRDRTVSLALVALLHLLLLLMLLRLAPPPERPVKRFVPIVVTLSSEKSITPSRRRAAEAPRARERVAPTKKPPVRPDAQPAPVSSIWSQVIPLTREDMAQANIARFPTRPAAPTGASAGESAARGSDDSPAAGKGPNGQTLYAARWYREPTHAELVTYLPPGWHTKGWGVIACETVANYRVDNCEEIGQSHSGLAGAVRKAAWQFRVMPPRIGGRSMVGAWVRIRIEYGVEEAR